MEEKDEVESVLLYMAKPTGHGNHVTAEGDAEKSVLPALFMSSDGRYICHICQKTFKTVSNKLNIDLFGFPSSSCISIANHIYSCFVHLLLNACLASHSCTASILKLSISRNNLANLIQLLSF